MKKNDIIIPIEIVTKKELSQSEKALVILAKEKAKNAYAPYSAFNVGAAILLENGVTIGGSNQENVSYPAGICAERTALFYANAQYPNVAVSTIVIVAMHDGVYTKSPISPCGICRQALVETENRYGKDIRIILYGESECYAIKKAKDLLPLTFSM